MSIFLNKFSNQIIILTLIFIVPRIDNLMFINNLEFSLNEDYEIALKNNFIEYFTFVHTIPIGKILFDKIILSLSLFLNVEIKYLFALFNTLTSFFLFSFCLKINYNKNYQISTLLIFLIIILSSIVFSKYEMWRISHHDHLNFFLVTLFVVIFTLKIKNFSNQNYIFFSTILILSSYTQGIIFSLATLFFLYLLNKNYFKIRHAFKIKYFFILILFFSLMCIKNYINVNSFSPSSMAGANLIQRTLHAIGFENYKKIVNKNDNLPEWFKNCTNNIYNQNSDLVSLNLNNFYSKLSHALCFTNKNDNKIDLKLFKSKNISKIKDDKFLHNLNKDISDEKNKIWIFSGAYHEASYRISATYLTYGKEIFVNALKEYPYEMIIGEIGKKGIFLTAIQMSSYAGFLPNYYESFSIKKNTFIKILNEFLRFIFIMILLLVPYVLYIESRKFNRTQIDFFCYVFFICLIGLMVFTTSTITCCENPRIVVILFPIILTIVMSTIQYILKK